MSQSRLPAYHSSFVTFHPSLQLGKHDYAESFQEPVVRRYPLLRDSYLSVISKPMDYETVGRKLDEGYYHNLAGFASDVNLVFDNAITFNNVPVDSMDIRDNDVSDEMRFGAYNRAVLC